MRKFVDNDNKEISYYYGTGKEIMQMFNDLLDNDAAYSNDNTIIIDNFDYALLLDNSDRIHMPTRTGYIEIPSMTIIGLYEGANDVELENTTEEPVDYAPGVGFYCPDNWEGDIEKYELPEDLTKEFYIGSPKQCIEIMMRLRDRKKAKCSRNYSLPEKGTFALVIDLQCNTMYISGWVDYIVQWRKINNKIDMY